MSLFSRRKKPLPIIHLTEEFDFPNTDETEEPNFYEEASRFFEEDNIRCDTIEDEETLVSVYRAFIHRSNTSNADDMREGLEWHDDNLDLYARALISQGFMMMRKIDALSDKVDRLENKYE